MMKDRLLEWLNRFLMLDLFLVLFGFAWFVVGLVGRAFEFPLGFDLWYRLWEPLFMPAISILMAGALLSGLTSWVAKRLAPMLEQKGD